jgi:hypothetical protein
MTQITRVRSHLSSLVLVAVFVLSGTAALRAQAPSITESGKLLPSDGANGDQFGLSVSVSGDTAAVAARYDDDNGAESGSVYVFVRSGGVWTQQAKLHPADGAADDQFGQSVVLPGETLVVGAHGDSDHGGNTGSAYVFVRSGSTWTQQAKLVASDGMADDYFGWSVSVSGDTAVVGAWGVDGSDSHSGSAYVFVRNGTSWSQQVKLVPSDGSADDVSLSYGSSVSVSGDTVLVGAYRDSDNGPVSGSVYVYLRAGTTWSEQAKLLASDGSQDDYFGQSVFLAGNTAVIGAYGDSDNGSASGSVYVFVRNGASWMEQIKLLASDGEANDILGQPVSLSGSTVVAGAFGAAGGGIESGAAYVFDVSPYVDSTPPVITSSLTGTAGTNGWYVTDVLLTWSVEDPESSVTTDGCDPVTISSDTPGTSFACSATSSGGTSSESVTVKRDATPPVLSPVVSPNPVLLNGVAVATPGAFDALSGVAGESCDPVATDTVGAKTVTCRATDNAGNTASAMAGYQVIYPWAGFFQPVDNWPTLNQTKAGSAVPVKFSLGGNQGLGIFAPGYPLSRQVVCGTGVPVDDVEQTVTIGGSGLSYDAATGQYVYVWKTDKAWARTCRELVVRLADGTEHVAAFTLK